MGQLNDLGEAEGWRCWLCDEPIDREMSPRDGNMAATRLNMKSARFIEVVSLVLDDLAGLSKYLQQAQTASTNHGQ